MSELKKELLPIVVAVEFAYCIVICLLLWQLIQLPQQ